MPAQRPPEREVPGKPQLWTPLFVLLTVANLCVSFTFYVLVATLSRFAVLAYDASPAEAGLVSSIFFLGAMVARLFAGRALVALGIRTVLVASLLALLVTCLAYFLTTAMASMLLIRVLHGIAYGFSATALASAVMTRVPASRRGEGSGWFTSGMALATGVAPFVGMLLAGGPAGQDAVFAVTIGCCIVALTATLAVVKTVPTGGVRQDSARRPPDRTRGLIEARALPIGAVVGLCALPFAAILAFLGSYAVERGLEGVASTYFLVYAGVILVSRPVAGVVQDRHGDDVVTIPLIVSLALGSVLTGLAPGPVWLLVAGALLGLGYGTLTSVGQAIAVTAVGPERVGLGVSSYFLLVEVGTGLGPVVLGLLAGPIGYGGMFVAGAGVTVLALIAYLALVRRPRREARWHPA